MDLAAADNALMEWTTGSNALALLRAVHSNGIFPSLSSGRLGRSHTAEVGHVSNRRRRPLATELAAGRMGAHSRLDRCHLPIVTSMNVSGQPELVDREEGLWFSASHGIALFVADPDTSEEVKGSFPILSFDNSGINWLGRGISPATYSTLCLPDGTSIGRTRSPPSIRWSPPTARLRLERCRPIYSERRSLNTSTGQATIK